MANGLAMAMMPQFLQKRMQQDPLYSQQQAYAQRATSPYQQGMDPLAYALTGVSGIVGQNMAGNQLQEKYQPQAEQYRSSLAAAMADKSVPDEVRAFAQIPGMEDSAVDLLKSNIKQRGMASIGTGEFERLSRAISSGKLSPQMEQAYKSRLEYLSQSPENVGARRGAEKGAVITGDFIKNAYENSQRATQSLNSYGTIENILDRYRSGPQEVLNQPMRKAATMLGITENEAMSDFAQMQSISKTLGINALAGFKGNTTERELAVAMSTEPQPENTVLSNIKIIASKAAALSVLQEESDFATRWKISNGSIDNLNDDGESYIQAWKKYQKEKYKEALDSYLPKIEAARRDAGLPSQTKSAIPDDVLQKARAAVQGGADKNAVMQRLQENGYDASGVEF